MSIIQLQKEVLHIQVKKAGYYLLHYKYSIISDSGTARAGVYVNSKNIVDFQTGGYYYRESQIYLQTSSFIKLNAEDKVELQAWCQTGVTVSIDGDAFI